MRAMGFRGGNFTIPHKVAVIEHLDRSSEAAATDGGRQLRLSTMATSSIGENTDGKGFRAIAANADRSRRKTRRDPRSGRSGSGDRGRDSASPAQRDITIVNRTPDAARNSCELLVDRHASRAARFVLDKTTSKCPRRPRS